MDAGILEVGTDGKGEVVINHPDLKPDENGVASNGTSKFLWQGEGERPTGDYCEWMPYQIGQAAKTEELEKKASAV